MIEEIQITDDDYNYNRYEEILLKLLDSMWRDDEDLVRGEDISDIPEVKIMFESYADKEVEDEEGNYVETIENGDTNQECYCIFIHKDSAQEDFQFPEHETAAFVFGNLIIHRPAEEVCIYAWYDVEHNDWSINALEETSEHEMTNKEVMDILEVLDKRYFFRTDDFEMVKDAQSSAWPWQKKEK